MTTSFLSFCFCGFFKDVVSQSLIPYFQPENASSHSLVSQFRLNFVHSQSLIPQLLQFYRSNPQSLIPHSFLPNLFSSLKVDKLNACHEKGWEETLGMLFHPTSAPYSLFNTTMLCKGKKKLMAATAAHAWIWASHFRIAGSNSRKMFPGVMHWFKYFAFVAQISHGYKI